MDWSCRRMAAQDCGAIDARARSSDGTVLALHHRVRERGSERRAVRNEVGMFAERLLHDVVLHRPVFTVAQAQEWAWASSPACIGDCARCADTTSSFILNLVACLFGASTVGGNQRDGAIDKPRVASRLEGQPVVKAPRCTASSPARWRRPARRVVAQRGRSRVRRHPRSTVIQLQRPGTPPGALPHAVGSHQRCRAAD